MKDGYPPEMLTSFDDCYCHVGGVDDSGSRVTAHEEAKVVILPPRACIMVNTITSVPDSDMGSSHGRDGLILVRHRLWRYVRDVAKDLPKAPEQ